MDAECEDIPSAACRGWIRHSQRFFSMLHLKKTYSMWCGGEFVALTALSYLQTSTGLPLVLWRRFNSWLKKPLEQELKCRWKSQEFSSAWRTIIIYLQFQNCMYSFSQRRLLFVQISTSLVSRWHGLSMNDSKKQSKLKCEFCSISYNHSPTDTSCNLQFTLTFIQPSAIIYIRTYIKQYFFTSCLSNVTVLHNETRTCHVYVHWPRYLLLRDELRILSKRMAFTGNLNCFQNALTVWQMARMIREMHQSK